MRNTPYILDELRFAGRESPDLDPEIQKTVEQVMEDIKMVLAKQKKRIPWNTLSSPAHFGQFFKSYSDFHGKERKELLQDRIYLKFIQAFYDFKRKKDSTPPQRNASDLNKTPQVLTAKKQKTKKTIYPLTPGQQEMVSANMGLVIRMVARLHIHTNFPQDVDDAVQAGNLGLIHAARKYNPDKEKFSTFACASIIWFIKNYFKERSKHGFHLSDHVVVAAAKVNKELAPDSDTIDNLVDENTRSKQTRDTVNEFLHTRLSPITGHSQDEAMNAVIQEKLDFEIAKKYRSPTPEDLLLAKEGVKPILKIFKQLPERHQKAFMIIVSHNRKEKENSLLETMVSELGVEYHRAQIIKNELKKIFALKLNMYPKIQASISYEVRSQLERLLDQSGNS